MGKGKGKGKVFLLLSCFVFKGKGEAGAASSKLMNILGHFRQLTKLPFKRKVVHILFTPLYLNIGLFRHSHLPFLQWQSE